MSEKLIDTWCLWSHNLVSKGWSLSDYKKITQIKTIGEFWGLFNSFDNLALSSNHYFFMRNGIIPLWEDENNKNGGICSIKLDFTLCKRLLEDLATHMVTNTLLKCNKVKINGISTSPKMSPRNSFLIVKIWNANKKYNISKLLCERVEKKYSNLNIIYKPHF